MVGCLIDNISLKGEQICQKVHREQNLFRTRDGQVKSYKSYKEAGQQGKEIGQLVVDLRGEGKTYPRA